MCHACVVESVKERMLSRRDLFRGTAAVTAGAALATTASLTSQSALAKGASSITDMTHIFDDKFPTYFGKPGVEMKQLFNFKENGLNLLTLDLNEHTGTHIDAPIHFSADGQSVDEIPIQNLAVPLAVIDVRAQTAEDADYEVTPDDIKAWIAKHGDLPEKCCVAMLSGWGDKVATDEFRNVGEDKKMHFPGFHIETTKMLLEETSAVGMAVDTLSLDHGISSDFKTHYAWLPENRYGIENLANLDKVPESGATLIVGAPTHRGGTGGPARIFAMV